MNYTRSLSVAGASVDGAAERGGGGGGGAWRGRGRQGAPEVARPPAPADWRALQSVRAVQNGRVVPARSYPIVSRRTATGERIVVDPRLAASTGVVRRRGCGRARAHARGINGILRFRRSA